MKFTTALAATAMFAALNTGAAPAAPAPAPTLTPEQMKQLEREASFEGALALVKLAFFSEYCQQVSNTAPAHVPAFKVERERTRVEGMPKGFQAYEYSYTGAKPKTESRTAGYCGRLTVAGPDNAILKGQLEAFDAMLASTGRIAQNYVGALNAGHATDETLTDSYMEMQKVARAFQGAVLQTMLAEPYRADGKPNLLGVSVSPPRPLLGGDEQVNRILERNIDELQSDLTRVIDANPLGGERYVPKDKPRQRTPGLQSV